MSQLANSMLPPFAETKLSMNSFLNNSYDSAVKQIGNGVCHIRDGVSFIREELNNLYDKTGYCITNMLSPVNNFLKDITDIDSDFQVQEQPLQRQHICTVIPIEIALLSPMEENY